MAARLHEVIRETGESHEDFFCCVTESCATIGGMRYTCHVSKKQHPACGDFFSAIGVTRIADTTLRFGTSARHSPRWTSLDRRDSRGRRCAQGRATHQGSSSGQDSRLIRIDMSEYSDALAATTATQPGGARIGERTLSEQPARGAKECRVAAGGGRVDRRASSDGTPRTAVAVWRSSIVGQVFNLPGRRRKKGRAG